MAADNVTRRFNWPAALGVLIVGPIVCGLLYWGLKAIGLSSALSAGIAIWLGGIPVGLLLGLLLRESPLLEACLGLGLGTLVLTTAITKDLVAGLVSGMMGTAVGGFAMWLGFGLAMWMRGPGAADAPELCPTCAAPLLATKRTGTGYCPRCDEYY